jgi:hypothetical protein
LFSFRRATMLQIEFSGHALESASKDRDRQLFM